MTNGLSVIKQISCLWRHLLPRRKKQLVIVALLMIVTSFAEVLSIGAVLPFLGALTSSEKVFDQEYVQFFTSALGIYSTQGLILLFTLLFVATAVFAALVRMTLVWLQARLSASIGADLSAQVFKSTLYQSYSVQVSRNSSETLASMAKAEGIISGLIQPALVIVSSFVILLTIFATFLVIQPYLTAVIFLGFSLIYVSIFAITKHRIKKNSQIIATQRGKVNKAIQEGVGGIRDILIDGTQPVYLKSYEDAFIPMQSAIANNLVLATSPRFGLEALGIVFIAGLAYQLSASNGVVNGMTSAIPALGMLALGAQRLLPVLQQIYYAYITVRGNEGSNLDALNLLDEVTQEQTYLEPSKPMAFQGAISLKNVGFRYTSHGRWVLRHINLQIPKGARIGFIGATGTGKSTLLDIFMGLLSPTEGTLLVDEVAVTSLNTRAWQAHIAHVPQAIYLSDVSVAENIAFGVPLANIDMKRVKDAAQSAQIAEVIESWPNKFDTLVGERGVRLSGGQRQRIGIARALYKGADVIIFDEATSALDSRTEAAVMQAVERTTLGVTFLIVAHRLATLKNCNQIVEVNECGANFIGGLEQMMRKSQPGSGKGSL